MTKDNNLLGKFELSGIPPAPRGVPQIEVTFDVDSNGIMNVSAADKTTGKSNKITITNEKGRLSKDDIERMVNEAERFKQDDEAVKDKIQSKNALENYTYSLRNSTQDDQLKDKFGPGDLEKLNKAIDETIHWLDSNQHASKEEYEHKQKELEGIAMPIMSKLYGGGAGPASGGVPPGGFPHGSQQQQSGPTVEEVD